MTEALIPASVPTPAEQAVLARYATSGTVITTAAFRRLLAPGRRLTCVHRSCGTSELPQGQQVFRPQRVVSVHGTFVVFSTLRVDVKKSYLDYPTKKNRQVIEEIQGGFVTVTGERRNTYLWLPDEAQAQEVTC